MNNTNKKVYLFSFLIVLLVLIIFIIKAQLDNKVRKEVNNNIIEVEDNTNQEEANNIEKEVNNNIIEVESNIDQENDNQVEEEIVEFLEEIDYDEFIQRYKDLELYEEKVSLVKQFFSQKKVLDEVKKKYSSFTPEDDAKNKSLYILTGIKNEWVSDNEEYLLYGALASILLDGLDFVEITDLWINLSLSGSVLSADCTNASPENKKNKCDGLEKRILDKEYSKGNELDDIVHTVTLNNFWVEWFRKNDD